VPPLSHFTISEDTSIGMVNIANMAVMGHIMKLATVKNQTAIWEYDLDLPGNCILGGSLDVIAAV